MKNRLVPQFIVMLFVLVCSVSSIATNSNDIEATWKLTTQNKSWQDMPSIKIVKGSKKADIVIDLDSEGQIIDGFGGSFNEKGWEALSWLTQDKRNEVIRALFDPKDGANFNICRVPIGASDFGVSRYSLNETQDDFEMKHFSIERDQKYKIPYIKAAMKYQPQLKVWGSVWTPPTWMKTNNDFDGGNMKDDPKVYDAFALYLARFIEAYQAEGINAYAVAVQNEPLVARNYPSCLWRPAQFLTFIRDYMGPLFEKRKVKADIMLGTMDDTNYFGHPKTVLNDEKANRYVSIVGYQWRGVSSVARTRKDYPEKNIMQTETECGNWYWKPGFDANRPQNDWSYASYTWKKVKDYFDAGVNSYMLWNMILDEEGKSIDAKRPWPQNAAIVVDRKTKDILYTPMYYAFKHFSRFIEPGARYINIAAGSLGAIAFKNPNGQLVIVLENDKAEAQTLTICFGNHHVNITLPEKSWSTIVIPLIK